MKRIEQDRLLKEILSGEDLTEFRQHSLERALTSIQRQRRRQRVVRTCALALVPLLLVAGFVWSRHQLMLPVPPPVVSQSSPPETGKVKVITDTELFALFPDRPMALIGKPGHQQLVFLDSVPATGQP